MSSKDTVPSFDDMEPASEAKKNDRTVDLEPGDEFTGRLLFRFSFVGKHDSDVLVIEDAASGAIRAYWCSNSVVRQLNEGDVQPECWISLRKSDEEESFETDDGEEVSYYPVEVRTKEVDA